MSVLLVFLALCASVGPALTGTACPERSSIYPCVCVSIPQTKKTSFTWVTCHRLQDTASLAAIFPALREMAIDHLYIYDSFWVEENKKETQVLPSDWLSQLKVKEIEIVDTPLSSCFACEASRLCTNSVTTRFTATNSSSHEKICSICKSRSGHKFSWVGCMSRLQKFHFKHSSLTAVREDLFPVPMRLLTEVDLSHNQIAEVDAAAFSQTPKLKLLDLSHNAIDKLDKMFGKMDLPDLEKLDLGWNLLKTLGTPSFFPRVPKLKSLMLGTNYISNLREAEWKGITDKIRDIDLSDNPIHCDCNIQWVNSTFAVHVTILGTCTTPEEFEDSAIRTASRNLNERCDKDGNIGTRPPKLKKTTQSL